MMSNTIAWICLVRSLRDPRIGIEMSAVWPCSIAAQQSRIPDVEINLLAQEMK